MSLALDAIKPDFSQAVTIPPEPSSPPVIGAVITPNIVYGRNKAFRNLVETILKIAPRNTTVLLQGESGTGKEVLARLIHNNSEKKNGPFVRVNCGAIPENLLESELFGHEKGAFTGAVHTKKGKFEIADGGTIFLDEIGELPHPLQVKLLHFIQEREFERIGSTKLFKVDVRLIAASNKDLEQAVENEEFREDLFYRLNVVPLYLPPLRERLEDLPDLINQIISKYNDELHRQVKGISDEALFIMQNYPWPGNIRELENVIERIMVISPKELITPDVLPKDLFGVLSHVRTKTSRFRFREKTDNLWEVEKGIIERALKECNNNQSKAARVLGISRNHLRYRIKKWKINV